MSARVIFFAAWLAAAGTGSLADNANEWQKSAAMDVAALRQALQENSPAVYVDKDSQLFRRWLVHGFSEAQRNVSRVMDGQGYYYLLRGYAGGFRDSHITVSMQPTSQVVAKVMRWPGIALSWRGGAYRVAYVDPARAARLPPVGAVLISCDGHPAESLARRRLDRYEADLNLEGGRYFSAPKLLWDMGNPFVGPLPESCVFDSRAMGQTFTLSFAPPAAGVIEMATSAAAGAAKSKLGVEKWQDQNWWIGLPSLLEAQDWTSFFHNIELHRDEIRSAPVVVFDVRGDRGGDSIYAERLAQMLWGEEVIRAYEPFRGDEIYRVSPLNRRFFADSLKEFTEKHEVNEYVAPFGQLVKDMDAAQSRGIALVTMHHAHPRRPDLTPANPMRGTVVVLTDYVCNSACLYMMDLFLRLPNVIQAGVTTSADTIFMEVGTKMLPSGKAQVGFGHKAWTSRPRGSNVSYTPPSAFTYSGDLGNDADVRAWLGGLPLIRVGPPFSGGAH